MTAAFLQRVFTPPVRALQVRHGSRERYAALDDADEERSIDAFSEREAAFIGERDGFYQATVNADGWPYVQFRGGPPGFLKVLDARTLAYADFRGNVQYVSDGNLQTDDRIALILMDYAQQRRLKIIGRARLVDLAEDPALIERLRMPGYRARVERAVVITLEAFDWNCPQHITPRFTEAEIDAAIAPLRAQLKQALAALDGAKTRRAESLGDGPLALQVSGIRQLTPRVRAYELMMADGSALPTVTPGAHIRLPMRLGDGRLTSRRYSIGPAAGRPDAWEVAVQREDSSGSSGSSGGSGGSSGSSAVHADYALGLRLHCELPGNDFALHNDARPAVLIAGGIGITPLRAMALALRAQGRPVRLRYAARSAAEAAYAASLQHVLGEAMVLHDSQTDRRMDLGQVLADAPPDAVFYGCGPARLIDDLRAQARRLGITDERVRIERFTPAPSAVPPRPITVHLQRSGRRIEVPAGQSILDAVQAAGIAAPDSCRAGTCGTCAVKVLAGTPEHRDEALSEAERQRAGLMCICVSRAVTDELTIDL